MSVITGILEINYYTNLSKIFVADDSSGRECARA